MITHHLSDRLLMAYSAGTLPEAFNLAVATHISMCDECRAKVASFDVIGGVVLDNATEEFAEMSVGSLAETLSRIKSAAPVARSRPRFSRDDLIPSPLRDYVGDDVAKLRWRNLGGGVRQVVIPTSRSATARLLHIPAGAAMPDHGHGGLELTLVLQGAFADDEARFGRGDIEIADEATEHQPIAEAGVDCICLAVTDAPLKFRGLLPRLAQPFFGI